MKDKYSKLAMIILILTNIHYPTLFYPMMNILLPILFIILSPLENY